MPGRDACGISGGRHLTAAVIILINCHDVIIGQSGGFRIRLRAHGEE